MDESSCSTSPGSRRRAIAAAESVADASPAICGEGMPVVAHLWSFPLQGDPPWRSDPFDRYESAMEVMHLLWIVPTAASLGFLVAAILRDSRHRDDEQRLVGSSADFQRGFGRPRRG